MRMTEILVIGKNGQIGFELSRSLSVLGGVVSLSREQCDLLQPEQVSAVLQKYQPKIIVNAAAYTAVDKAEQDADNAAGVNAGGVAILADWANGNDALLLHYSTDYIFDGAKHTPYTEEDTPNPLSVYGRTKWEGEQAIRHSGCRHLIFRTSWVFGQHGSNFFKTMLKLAAERDTLNVVADQRGTPTAACLIADVTAHVLAQYLRSSAPSKFPFGTYNVTAEGDTTWHDYARLIIEYASLLELPLKTRPQAILPIKSIDYPSVALRPLYSCLTSAKLKQTFKLEVPHWKTCLKYVMQLPN
ncbi:dTDP-4-dehydrorhamnose reductase [Chitiniphilus shinanonensis]|uniref:dTDP-4-dehydrorhamnose reductase n=1 Tax=Chitiniphilus shinanonensis TaxID=553088 RepID=UPI003340EBC8